MTPAELNAHLLALHSNGRSATAIGAAVGLTKDQVRHRLLKLLAAEAMTEHRAGLTEDIGALWQRARDDEQARKDKLADAFDWLRPVELPLAPRVPVTLTPNACYVVSSDHHWPLQDEGAESIILQAIERLRPRGYVLNGDGPDMLALSKYPKDARHGKSWELRTEQAAAKSWWAEVDRIGQAWGIEKSETQSNHAGDGQASRLRRWLNENASALFSLDGFEALMTYPRFFHPDGAGVQLVDEVVIANDLRIRHGEIVRKHGGYSARAHGDKWGSSVMHGHTHRIGSSMKRRPGIPGVRPDEFLRTFETGCVCKLDADYCPGADWQQGFAVIHVDDATNDYGVELVQIINGRATSTSLGGTLKAA